MTDPAATVPGMSRPLYVRLTLAGRPIAGMPAAVLTAASRIEGVVLEARGDVVVDGFETYPDGWRSSLPEPLTAQLGERFRLRAAELYADEPARGPSRPIGHAAGDEDGRFILGHLTPEDEPRAIALAARHVLEAATRDGIPDATRLFLVQIAGATAAVATALALTEQIEVVEVTPNPPTDGVTA